MAASEDPQKRLQALSEEYQRLQQSKSLPLSIPSKSNPTTTTRTGLSDLVSARQKLSSQQQENQSVKNEFGKLDAESQIYKLVGPVLLKQDHAEAGMAVDGRLEYIGKEL